MTLDELCLEIATRLNDNHQIKYDTPLIKGILLKAMNVVLTTKEMAENDYAGLISSKSVSPPSYDFGEPINRIKTIFGDDRKNIYLPRTVEEIQMIRDEEHLLPRYSQAFYFMVGTTLNFIPPIDDDSLFDSTVTVWYVKNPYDSLTVDIKTIYSDSFIESSVRETIKRILIELDTRD